MPLCFTLRPWLYNTHSASCHLVSSHRAFGSCCHVSHCTRCSCRCFTPRPRLTLSASHRALGLCHRISQHAVGSCRCVASDHALGWCGHIIQHPWLVLSCTALRPRLALRHHNMYPSCITPCPCAVVFHIKPFAGAVASHHTLGFMPSCITLSPWLMPSCFTPAGC